MENEIPPTTVGKLKIGGIKSKIRCQKYEILLD